MATNTSLVLNSLDFDTIKNTFKMYLKSQDRFKDYDFDGSNMNVLLDILSLNTFHNAFYLNMIGNESFIDSAQLRDSVVSHAKDLNYTPRSFTSAKATVNLTVTSNDLTKRSILVQKGTSFTSNFGTKNYTFTVPENIVLSDFEIVGSQIRFYGSNITIYEGFYVSDIFTFNYAEPQRFVLSNKNIDISSASVLVIEDMGASVLTYNKAQSLFDLNSSSRVFFVQGAENESYEIVFGDGVSGRKPKDNSTVKIEYRVSNGELPNGCNKFTPDTTIDGESNIQVTTVSSASSGSVSESIDSIKFNAPRHFTTQERAVTTEDYENLLKANFPEINAVTAFGGEDLSPPKFGKVFVSVDLNEVDGIPEAKKDEYFKFLRPRSPVSIEPIFVDPDYMYIGVNSVIKYNVDTTILSSNDVRTISLSSILDYAKTNLNNFNRTFRYSNFVKTIDASQISIISNETSVSAIRIIRPDVGQFRSYTIDYGIPFDTSRMASTGGYTITSTQFTYAGQLSYLTDDNGQINVMSTASGALIDTVGTVDYELGRVQLSNFRVTDYVGSGIKIYATPLSKDIATTNNVILNIIEEDVKISVIPTKA